MKFGFYLTAVLVILKLWPGITTSWWGVFSPLLAYTAITLVLVFGVGLLKGITKGILHRQLTIKRAHE